MELGDQYSVDQAAKGSKRDGDDHNDDHRYSRTCKSGAGNAGKTDNTAGRKIDSSADQDKRSADADQARIGGNTKDLTDISRSQKRICRQAENDHKDQHQA